MSFSYIVQICIEKNWDMMARTWTTSLKINAGEIHYHKLFFLGAMLYSITGVKLVSVALNDNAL